MQLIKGKRTVYEALKANVKLERIVIDYKSQHDPDIQSIIQLARHHRIKFQVLPTQAFQAQADTEFAQGVVAYSKPAAAKELDDIFENIDEYPIILMCDHLQDPYNFGAILRTCETLGIRAVIYPKDRACQITPGVMKVSSGAIHYLDLVKVSNLGYALDRLKTAGYQVCGADSNDGQSLDKIKPDFPVVIVVGNEDKGLSHLISKKIDLKINIPLSGQVESMNVSVATGIILYTFHRLLQKR